MKKTIWVISLIGLIFLTGCSLAGTPLDDAQEILADMNDVEAVYSARQSDLQEIEQAEQKLFEETMEFKQEEISKITENHVHLLAMLEERVLKIDEEAKAMQEGEKWVAKLAKVAAKLTDDEKIAIEQLADAAALRYDKHAVFIEHYKAFTAQQKSIYELLIDKEPKKLDTLVEELNRKRIIMSDAVDEFNEATIEMNQMKKDALKLFGR